MGLYLTGTTWGDNTPIGLFSLETNRLADASNGLEDLESVRPEATAHPWGPALAFARHLEGEPNKTKTDAARRLVRFYLRALVAGVVRLEAVPLSGAAGNLTSLSEILRLTWDGPPLTELLVLRTTHQVEGVAAQLAIAVSHPACLFFPAAVFSDWPDKLDSEQPLVTETEQRFATDPDTLVPLYAELLDRLLDAVKLAGPAWKEVIEGERRLLSGQMAHDASRVRKGASFPVSRTEVVAVPLLRDALLDAIHAGEGTGDSTGTVVRVYQTTLRDSNGKTWPDFPEIWQTNNGFGSPLLVGKDGSFEYVGNPPAPGQPPEVVNGWQANLAFGHGVRLRKQHSAVHIDLTVTARLVSIAAGGDGLLCGALVKLHPPGQASGRWPDSPVRPDCLRYVDRARIVEDTGTSVQYELTLATGVTVKTPPLEEHRLFAPKDGSPSFCIGIWPDFECGNWDTYRVFFMPEGYRGDDARLVVINSKGDRRTIGGSVTPVEDVTGRPKQLCVMVGVEPLGVFDVPDAVAQFEPGEQQRFALEAALDFGTANSCVSVGDGRGTGVSVAFMDLWQQVFGPNPLADEIRELCADTLPGGATELPSELVLHGADASGSLREGWVAIPSPGIDTAVKHINTGKLAAGFKWQDAALLPFNAGPHDRPNAVKHYLGHLLRACCATLQREHKGRVNQLKLRALYPRAYAPEQFTDYSKALVDAAADFGQRTGIAVHVEGYVDEATAAILGAQAGALNLAIDIGGGTTDIAVAGGIRAGGSGATAADVEVSSLRLAGHDIVRVLASRLTSQPGFTAGDLTKVRNFADAVRVLKVLHMIRSNGISSPLLGFALGNAEKQEVEKGISDAFLAIAHWAAQMTARRVLKLAQSQQAVPTVTVQLTGNGWGLVGLIEALFPSWSANHESCECGYAKLLLKNCWLLLQAGNKALPDVSFAVTRVAGKGSASIHALNAAVSTPTQVAIQYPCDPLGIDLTADGTAVPAASSLPHFVSPNQTAAILTGPAWGMPTQLKAYFRGGVEAALGAFSARFGLVKAFGSAVPDSIISQPGLYLMTSPLKLFFEDDASFKSRLGKP